jgi:hypothetical protein
VSAVCRTHAEHILDADRRGDPVSTDDWVVAEGDARPALGAMPCTWMLALRATDETATVVGLDATPSSAPPPSPAEGPVDGADRWVSIDEVSLDAPPPEEDVSIVVGNDLWRHAISPRPKATLPALVVLAPDEHITLVAQRHDGGDVATIAEARLPLDRTGDASATVVLATREGSRIAAVRVRARVRRAEPPP